ncbi:MAG: hypothetical protein AMXMBFR4_16190 [Candidatus Hydrogenedentota bacterium]
MNTREDMGFILVAVIWIMAILAVLTLGFAHRSMLDQRAAALSLDHMEATYAARGAVVYAVAELRNRAAVDAIVAQGRGELQQQRRRTNSGRRAPVAQQINVFQEGPDLYAEGGPFAAASEAGAGETATYRLEDAERRISLNTSPEEIFDNIEELSFTTVSAIMRRRGGDLDPNKRALFTTVEDARHLDGMDESDWEGDVDKPGLRDLLTVYGEGRININTAPREVLEAIPDLDESVIGSIIAFRAGKDGTLMTEDDRGFRSLDGMSRLLGLSSEQLAPIARYCTFESRYFTITGFATKRLGNVRAACRAVVHLQPETVRVLNWSEGHFGQEI